MPEGRSGGPRGHKIRDRCCNVVLHRVAPQAGVSPTVSCEDLNEHRHISVIGASSFVRAERLRGSAERIGVPCAGLVEPGTCATEGVRDRARLGGGSIGIAFAELVQEQFDVSITADWMVAELHVHTQGLSSGRAVSASKVMWGPQLGVASLWRPVKGVPLALEIGGAVRGLLPVVQTNVTDGYTPFEDSFGGALAHIGVSWRIGSR